MRKRPHEERRLTVRTDDGVPVAATHLSGGSARLVVLAPGFWRKRSDRENRFVATHLSRMGYDVVTFDFRGHGESGGRYSFGAHEWRDLLAVARHFHQGGREFAAVGFSMGGSIAADALSRAPELPFRALVMVSSPADFARVRPRPWKRAAWKMMHFARALSPPRVDWTQMGSEKPAAEIAVEMLTIPKLIVTFEGDWLIEPSHGDRLAARAAPPVERAHLKVGDSLHADAVIRFAPVAFLDVLTAFLRKNFPAPE